MLAEWLRQPSKFCKANRFRNVSLVVGNFLFSVKILEYLAKVEEIRPGRENGCWHF